MPRPPRWVEATEGTPPGTVVMGAPGWADGLVQTALGNVAGVELTGPASLTAQLGGTDSLPTEEACPTPADTRIALNPAEPIGVGAAVGGALLTSPVKPKMPAELAPWLASGANCPWARSSMSDEAALKFCAQLNGVPIVAPKFDGKSPAAGGVAPDEPPLSALSSPVTDVEPVVAWLVDSV